MKALHFPSNFVFNGIQVWYRHCTLKKLSFNFTTFVLQVCFKKTLSIIIADTSCILWGEIFCHMNRVQYSFSVFPGRNKEKRSA